MPVFVIFIMMHFLGGLQDRTKTTVAEHHDYFTTDNLGNIYLVDGPELLKYSAQGKRMARYSNLRMGGISNVDATNPLKILVYYRDFQQVLFLDNQLSPNGQAVSLEALGLEQAGLVAASANNSFWVYDKRNNELHRYSEQTRRIVSTGNLKQVLTTAMKPVEMKEHNNFLYVNSPEAGIFVFDIFGAFSRLIPLTKVEEFQVTDEILYSRRGRRICSFDKLRLEENCDSLMHPGIVAAAVANGSKYFSYRDSIKVFPL